MMFRSGVHVWLSSISTGFIALMVGAVSNCAYAVRLETAPTGPYRLWYKRPLLMN